MEISSVFCSGFTRLCDYHPPFDQSSNQTLERTNSSSWSSSRQMNLRARIHTRESDLGVSSLQEAAGVSSASSGLPSGTQSKRSLRRHRAARTRWSVPSVKYSGQEFNQIQSVEAEVRF